MTKINEIYVSVKFQGSMLTTIGLLGTLLNIAVIYFLLRRRIRLAKCQNLFIVNLSISDGLVSLIGVFRGLGIIDSRFVGTLDNTATPACAVYVLLLHSFGHSGMMALLPLTIDRAVAIILPLKHGIIITRKICFFIFAATWMSILIVLFNDVVGVSDESITIVYTAKYHRCVLYGKDLSVERTLLYIAPFLLIIIMYGTMLFIILKTRRSCGRFLFTASGIIATSIIFYTPGVIFDMGLEIGYKATQVFYVTFWYVNGVINPLIYVGSHPKTWEFIKSKFTTG